MGILRRGGGTGAQGRASAGAGTAAGAGNGVRAGTAQAEAAQGRDDGGLAAQVREALRRVIDPELGLNVVDLGLVYGIRVESGHAQITMTMTTAGCPAQNYLKEKARLAVLRVPGIASAAVDIVWVPRWTPEMMSDEGKRWFGYA